MPATSAAGPVRLGLLAPLSGVAAMYAEDIPRAARIAAARINAGGGINGRPLELLVTDDGCLPATAIEAGRDLVAQGCVALVGSLMSNVRLEVVQSVAERLEVPLLNFSFYEGSISSSYFFNFAALPNQQIELMIGYMAERVGPRMYFAGNNYEWPRGSIATATQALMRVDGDVIGEEYADFDMGPAECDELLQRVASAAPDVFVPYFVGADQVRVLTRLQELGLHHRFAVLLAHFDEVMASLLSPDARSGLYAANSYFMTVGTEQNRQLLAELEAEEGITGVWPDGNGVVSHFAEGAHVCVTAFGQAARRAGSLQGPRLIRALERVSFDAAQGRIVMDAATHHAHVNSYLIRCGRDGRFQLLETFGRIAPDIPDRYLDEPANRPETPAMTPRTRRERRRLRSAAMQRTDVSLLVTTLNGIILEANPAAEALFGYDVKELLGRNVEALVPPHLREAHRAALRRLRESPARRRDPIAQHGKVHGYRKDGTYFAMSAVMARMRVAGEDVVTISARDVSAHNDAESELRHAATHDELTGLANRTCITQRLSRSLARAAKATETLGVLVIDLDSFKSVNDTFGHAAGDGVLQQVAARLLHCVRPGDAVARLAGDEFLVLAERLRAPEDLGQLAERIVVNLAEPIDWSGTRIRVTASIGMAVSDGDTDVQSLVNQANLAMTNVKERHAGDWEFYSATLHESAQRRQQLSQHVRAAVDNDEFYPHFQPIVRLTDGRIMGVEVLTRWNSQLGPVSPAEFIPIAESTGAIHALGSWVLQQACQAEAAWHQRWGHAAPRIFINVSPRQLSSRRFVADVLTIARESGTDIGQIVLELTESGLMGDLASARVVVEEIVDSGIAVAVDDFGTGYSSLAELTQLPVQLLKIDRSFVSSAVGSARSARVLEAVVNLGSALKLHTLAEGVETAAEAELVRRFGCEFAQGFYFGVPMGRAEIEQAIDHQLGAGAGTQARVPISRKARSDQPPLRALGAS